MSYVIIRTSYSFQLNYIMDGLMIKRPWIDLILSGKKTWEIRGSNTEKRGAIALIESGSKHIVGIARLVKVRGPLELSDYVHYKSYHLATPDELSELPYPHTYAWELADAEPLLEPVKYEHPLGAITWVNLKSININDLTSIKRKFHIPSQVLKNKFIKSIEKDLEYLNQDFNYDCDSSLNNAQITIGSKLHNYTTKEEVRDIYNKLRKRLLLSDKEFIARVERKYDILQYFANGDEINFSTIKPEVRECISQKDKDLFKYCSYLESVPSSGGIGRRISAIVWDTGQKTEKIMGIIGLSSAGYSLKCRDDYFNWNQSIIDSFKRLKDIKDEGLRKIMQLSICMAVPPYSFAFAAKLMTVLSFSKPIQEIYQRKYKDPLLAIIATGVFGDHAALYNRIKTSKLIDSKTNKNIDLFVKIGNTSEYSNLILSDETKEIAKDVLKNSICNTSTSNQSRNKNFSTNNELIRAIKICGLNKEILALNRKVVYLGAVNSSNIEILRGKRIKARTNLPIINCISYWRDEYINKKFLLSDDKIKDFRNFSKNELSINEQLKLF